MPDSDFVRVKHPLFGEYSARRPDLSKVELLNKPAVDRNGKPLPAKPKTTVAALAAAKKKTPNNGGELAKNPEEGSK